MPKVRIRDDHKLEPNAYQIASLASPSRPASCCPTAYWRSTPAGSRPTLQGVATRDPAYGLPAFWITEDSATGRARPATRWWIRTVAITHLSEVVRKTPPTLLTRAETERLLDRLRPQHAGLLDEVMPQVLSMGEIQKVLQNLLQAKRYRYAISKESSKCSPMPGGRTRTASSDRAGAPATRLAICQGLANRAGELYVLTLDPSVEHHPRTNIRSIDDKSTLVLEPRFAEQMLSLIAAQVEKMMKGNIMPVLLCAPELRRHLRRLTERVMPHLSIVSMAEVPNSVSLKAFGVVSLMKINPAFLRTAPRAARKHRCCSRRMPTRSRLTLGQIIKGRVLLSF